MRSYDKHRNTRFVQKSDVEKGALVTISKITEEEFTRDNGAVETKYVLHFEEDYNPWVPNIGSLGEIKSITGTGDVDSWLGTKIVLYVNPDIEHRGQRVGGIRCRPPKPGFTSQEETQQPVDSDIPF